MERTFTHEQARRFYDRLGARQDTQAFYEDPPNHDLAAHFALSDARAVFELGCGTGRFAEYLLTHGLPPTARYHAIDLSPAMVELARKRLAGFGTRVRVESSPGDLRLPAEDGTVDRFVSTYVFDLLSRDDIERAVKEAHRVLEPGGLAGVTSLTFGCSGMSRFVSSLWGFVQRARPGLVGGCRPLDVRPFFGAPDWTLEHEAVHTTRGLTSQVVVARKRAG